MPTMSDLDCFLVGLGFWWEMDLQSDSATVVFFSLGCMEAKDDTPFLHTSNYAPLSFAGLSSKGELMA